MGIQHGMRDPIFSLKVCANLKTAGPQWKNKKPAVLTADLSFLTVAKRLYRIPMGKKRGTLGPFPSRLAEQKIPKTPDFRI
jgi:hypothetical protein